MLKQSLLIVVVLLAAGRLSAQVQPAFPEPSGPFKVGRLEIDVTDASRDETFTDDTTDKRRLLVGGVWAADQRFVLDQLATWNAQHPQLRDRLDLQRIGVFGHSLGGAAAAGAARLDERIDAAINLDGGMFGAVSTEGSRVPFLLVNAEIPVPSDAELKQAGMTREQADALLASIVEIRTRVVTRSKVGRAQTLGGARHNTFMTDLLFLTTAIPAEQRAPLVGNVDPTIAFGRITTWIGDFMAEHVAHR